MGTKKQNQATDDVIDAIAYGGPGVAERALRSFLEQHNLKDGVQHAMVTEMSMESMGGPSLGLVVIQGGALPVMTQHNVPRRIKVIMELYVT